MTTPHAVERPARRGGLAAFAALVAVSALGGAAGLMVGAVDFGAAVDRRLPLQSPVLAGCALALMVGAPAAALALLAARRDPRTDLGAMVAGGLLVVWIVVEVAVIRELSFLQPVFAVAGAGLVFAGRRALRPAPADR